MTVLGPVDAGDLGVVCPHEHLAIDMSCYLETPGDPRERDLAAEPVHLGNRNLVENRPELVHDNFRLDDPALAARELTKYKRAGGGTIVDVTLDGIARQPLTLVSLSESTQVHIVMGCGYYVWQSHPPEVEAESVAQLANRMVDDLTVGAHGTDIRAGVIGEIGTSPEVHPRERKVLRAAASAQLRTGAAITIHACSTTRHALEVLDILEDAGLKSFARVVVGHQDAVLDLDYHLAVLDRGAYVEFDLFGHHYFDASFGDYWMPGDGERVALLAELTERGYTRQLLISQDVCMKMQLTEYGGGGYTYLSDWVEPRMRAAGIGTSAIHQMRVENPATLLDTVSGENLDLDSAKAESA